MTLVRGDSVRGERSPAVRGERSRTAWCFSLAILLVACRHPSPAEHVVGPLVGLTLPLTPSSVLRLEVDGSIGARPAQIKLEVAQAMSTATPACWDPLAVRPRKRVRLPQPDGKLKLLDEVPLAELTLGGRVLDALSVARVPSSGPCVVTLGMDVLSAYALEIRSVERQLRFLPPRTAESYDALTPSPRTERFVVPLERDPRTDFLLLATRIQQRGGELFGPFIIATSLARSVVGEDAAREAHLHPWAGEPLPHAPADAPDGPAVLVPDRVALLPTLSLDWMGLSVEHGWRNTEALGLLGSDVWGHFHAIVDIPARRLVLERPAVVGSAVTPKCDVHPGEASEEACFALRPQRVSSGFEVYTNVFRDLPQGARLYVEPVDAAGQEVRSGCRFGVSTGPSDRGLAMAFRIPWDQFEPFLASCSAAMNKAKSVRFALWEEGELKQCPGTCAFVELVRGGQTSCMCAAPEGDTQADMLLQSYREFFPRKAPEKLKAPETEEQLPVDPE